MPNMKCNHDHLTFVAREDREVRRYRCDSCEAVLWLRGLTIMYPNASGNLVYARPKG